MEHQITIVSKTRFTALIKLEIWGQRGRLMILCPHLTNVPKIYWGQRVRLNLRIVPITTDPLPPPKMGQRSIAPLPPKWGPQY